MTSGKSVFTYSIDWILSVIAGPLSVSVATIAVSLIGLTMFFGLVDRKRFISVIIGVFLIFGAARIGASLVSIMGVQTGFTSHNVNKSPLENSDNSTGSDGRHGSNPFDPY